jgi:para-aminobenzoate synthetase component 1
LFEIGRRISFGAMCLLRLDSSQPRRNPRWSMPPVAGGERIIADAAGAVQTIQSLESQSRRCACRWVGYFAYGLGAALEAAMPRRTDGAPLVCFASCAPGQSPPPRQHPTLRSPLISTFSRAAYLQAVQTCKDYIAAGDVYQINLSQRFSVGLEQAPLEIYQRLMSRHPALYGAYLDFGDQVLISNSPELFLRIEPLPDGRRRIITRPIKGTRPLGAGMEIALRESLKDQAELNMIVDLERNDLGRICEIGSVRVTQPRTIETYPTVYHGVATIEGILRDDVTLLEILRATFPGGSITGAPKIRAMQIIHELEPVARGAYCGAIGYIDPDGAMEFNIAIRTMIIQDGMVHFAVGGGVVADSDPAAEYEETLVKARAMFEALQIEPGLD